MAQKKAPKAEVRFDTVLCNLRGVPLKTEDGPLSLAMVATGALLANEERLSGVEKFSRYQLAKRIDSEDQPISLSSVEIELIKKVIGVHCTPLAVGCAYDALDGKAMPKRAHPEPCAEVG